jgi:hypothetical protein
MLLAFVATTLADSNARLHQRARNAGVVISLAADDIPGRSTNVGAVLAQPDALDQLEKLVFAQVSIGIHRTRRCTVIERVDSTGYCAGVNGGGARITV